MKTRWIVLLGLLAIAGCDKIVEAGRASRRELGQSGSKRELDRIAATYESGKVATAAVELQDFVRRHPDNALAWVILGHAWKDLDDLPAAEKAYRRALKIDANRVEALTGLGILARKNGDDEGAMAYYQKAVAIDPSYGQAYSSMTVIALRHHDDAKALEYARKAWDLDKTDAAIAANLAVAYHYNGQTAERDRMTTEAKKLGYKKIAVLEKIYSGEQTIRD